MHLVVTAYTLSHGPSQEEGLCRFQDLTALHLAAYEGKLDGMRFLLSKGADVHAVAEKTDVRVFAPLHCAPYTQRQRRSWQLTLWSTLAPCCWLSDSCRCGWSCTHSHLPNQAVTYSVKHMSGCCAALPQRSSGHTLLSTAGTHM